MTYGDGLANIDIAAEIAFHTQRGCKATVACVRPPARFGRIAIEGTQAISFEEKPQAEGGSDQRRLLRARAERARADRRRANRVGEGADGSPGGGRQLAAWIHRGFWQPMDTLRDKHHLNALWDSGAAPWKLWQG